MSTPHFRALGAVDSLFRAVRWHRRGIAAVAVFVAVLAALSVLQPRPVDRVTVIAAARDLAGGSLLEAADLTQVSLPVDSAPVGAATDRTALVGKTLTAPVTARSVFTTASTATGQALARPGFVVVAFTLPDAALAPLVQPGALIDVITRAKGEPIATGVRVVSAPAGAAKGFSLDSPSRAVLLEVSPAVAARLATINDGGGFTIALH